MFRVAIFSDVHGNLAALRAVFRAIDRHGPVQLTVAAGDLVFPAGPRPAETFDLLVERGCTLLLGNHDVLHEVHDATPNTAFGAMIQRQLPWCIAQLGGERIDALRRLPRQCRLSLAPGHDLLIVHASLRDVGGHAASPLTDEQVLRECYGGANARVIAFGHWHESFVRSWAEGVLVNVASVSLPKDGQPLAAYSLLTWDGEDWQIAQYRVPYDTADEAAAVVASGMPL